MLSSIMLHPYLESQEIKWVIFTANFRELCINFYQLFPCIPTIQRQRQRQRQTPYLERRWRKESDSAHPPDCIDHPDHLTGAQCSVQCLAQICFMGCCALFALLLLSVCAFFLLVACRFCVFSFWTVTVHLPSAAAPLSETLSPRCLSDWIH